ncbi:hypothetical protein CASFOL_019573 [Castilleja foliolosa]|uniref:Uncharacterized protein n=1 Tax=Castilleja foliolosa TaxID=1961234 RepID=A0ABD3D608_9LAMI
MLTTKHIEFFSSYLQGLYVDRVVVKERTVPISYPSLKNWTYKLLREREQLELKSGGFGFGFPEGRLKKTGSEENQGKKRTSSIPTSTPDSCIDEPLTAKNFADKFLKEAKVMAESMSKIMSMLESAPQEIMDNMILKHVISQTEQMMGFCKPKTTPQKKPDVAMSDSQEDREFWGNPEVMAIIEELERTACKRQNFKSYLDDYPTYDLGISNEGMQVGSEGPVEEGMSAECLEKDDGTQKQPVEIHSPHHQRKFTW